MWASLLARTVKSLPAGDRGLIPGSGKSPGEQNGNPLQYSCLENPIDGEAWWATVHRRRLLSTAAGYCPRGRKEWDMTEQLHFHFSPSQLNPGFPMLMAGVKFCTVLQYSHHSS